MQQFNDLEAAYNCWAAACAAALNKDVTTGYLANIAQIGDSNAICYANGGDRMMHCVREIEADRHEDVVLLLRAKEGFSVLRLHYAYTTADKRPVGMRFIMMPFNDIADACLADLLYDHIVYPVTCCGVDDFRAAGWEEIWF